MRSSEYSAGSIMKHNVGSKVRQCRQRNKDESVYPPRYVPFSIINKWRRLDLPIKIKGKKVSRYESVVISEYVDTSTGEILPVGTLKNDPDLWPTVYASERFMQREFILNALRKEVQEFAYFVLAFRNQRRGVTPAFQELVKWYAHLMNKQPCHVQRYIKVLEVAQIIAGSELLAPLFMIAGKSVAVREHLSEDANASAKFAVMLLKRRAHNEIDNKPPWEPECIENHGASDERNDRVASLKLREILDSIDKMVLEGKLETQFA
jgi:hypothetical protein